MSSHEVLHLFRQENGDPKRCRPHNDLFEVMSQSTFVGGQSPNGRSILLNNKEYIVEKTKNPFLNVFGTSPEDLRTKGIVKKTNEDMTDEVFYALNGACSRCALRNKKSVIYVVSRTKDDSLRLDNARTIHPKGMMYAELVTSGRCINFVDVYRFSMCSETDTFCEETTKDIYDYTFTEKTHGTVKKDFQRYLDMADDFEEELIDSVVIQFLYAIGIIQRMYGIDHNLSLENLMIFDLSQSNLEFNGENVNDATWFSYDIDGRKVYFRNRRLILKIGHSENVKYSTDDITESLFRRYREKSNLLRRILISDDRSNFTSLKRNAWKYLLDPDVMKDHFTKPKFQCSIVQLGK